MPRQGQDLSGYLNLVRKERLELSRVTPLEPKSSASTSSATLAKPPNRGSPAVYNRFDYKYPTQATEMPIVLAFFFYLLGCMVLSALLLPWLQPFFAETLGAAPDRALYRFGMVLTLIGLPFFLRALDIRGREALGFTKPSRGYASTLGQSLGIGILILLGLQLLLLASGARTPEMLESDWLLKVLRYALAGLISGLLVGLIEEFFFRGAMHTGARRFSSFWTTALLTGSFFSIVHFMRPIGLQGELDLGSALAMLLGGFERLSELDQDIDRFVALLICGIFLSMLRERTGSIWWPIGVHAGWVMVIKISKAMTDSVPGSPWAWLLSGDGTTGWLASVWLGSLAAFYWWWSRPNAPTHKT